MASTGPGLAILGAGIFAKEAHLPALAALAEAGGPAFALKAVYSRSQASAQSLAGAAQAALKLGAPPAVFYDVSENGPAEASIALDALLKREDIAAVIVVLPINTQPEIILRALAAGKHVISEKPVAPDVKAGATLIAKYLAEYKPKGLIWRVAENFEAEAGFRTAGKLIADGVIGTIQAFDVRVVNYVDAGSKWYKTPWRTVPEYQGGFLLDGGVHTIAALRELLPSPLASLSGHASLAKKILLPHDTISASVVTASGAHGTVLMTFGAPAPGAAGAFGGSGFSLFGASGWLTVTNAERADGTGVLRIAYTQVTETRGADGETVQKTEETVVDEPTAGVRVELASFIDALAGKDDGLGLGDPRNALKDVAFIEAALKSGGRAVDLEKLAASGEIA